MTVNLVQWRAVIGIFDYRSSEKTNNNNIYKMTKNNISLIECLFSAVITLKKVMFRY